MLREVVGGRYEVVDELGRGGMAVVYRARDQVLDREVALKVLAPERAGDASFVRRFEREARAVAALNHPNVVAIHDTGDDGGTYYLVMELVRGPTLADLLAEEGPLPPRRAAAIAHGVCRGLAAAHRRDIVHRDVKPSNVVFDTENDTVKVADFGLARSATDTTASTTVYGSAPYMAPEQARGVDPDPRTDVYAVGCVLHEMLTGRPPFTGDSALAVVAQHQNEQPPALTDLRPGTPAVLASVVERCLRKDPDARYQDADELAEALEGPAGLVAGAAPVSATQVLAAPTERVTTRAGATGTPAASDGPGGRRARQAALLGLIALAALAVLVWSLDDDRSETADGGDPPAATEPVDGDGEPAAEDVEDAEDEDEVPRSVDELAGDLVRAVLAAERDGELDEGVADDLAKRGEEMIRRYREGRLRDVRDEIYDARDDLDDAIADGEVSAALARDLGAHLDAIADALGVPRPTPSPITPSPTPGR